MKKEGQYLQNQIGWRFPARRTLSASRTRSRITDFGKRASPFLQTCPYYFCYVISSIFFFLLGGYLYLYFSFCIFLCRVTSFSYVHLSLCDFFFLSPCCWCMNILFYNKINKLLFIFVFNEYIYNFHIFSFWISFNKTKDNISDLRDRPFINIGITGYEKYQQRRYGVQERVKERKKKEGKKIIGKRRE